MNEKEIGRNKYNSIINKSELTDTEKRQIKKYESDRGLSKEQKAKVAKYFESIQDKKTELPEYAEASISSLYFQFKHFYKLENNKKFEPEANNGEAKVLAVTLLYYFFKSQSFYKSPLLNQTISKPDLKKGLLVVGGTGCGKTSTFKAIHSMLFTG